MPQSTFGEILRFLHKACAFPAAGALTDGELLERFLTQREESAFAALVERHGPMILGVGQRVLGDAHAAEDVLQATFLVLARRTGAIGGKKSVGGWLHGVAQHVALKARAQTAARRLRERKATEMRDAQPADDLSCRELRAALDEALAALPEKHRAPIVLCYLEGKSHGQAAKELGWPKNSLTNRLTRARELLRRQLERRGIGLAAGALATALGEMAAAAPMSGLLTIKTVKAVAVVVAGKAVAGGYLSARALALAEDAMAGMVGIKGKLVLMVLAVGLAVGGAGWAGYKGLTPPTQSDFVADTQPRAAKKPAEVAAKKDAVAAVDQYGDPLPEGALARLGTIRLRHDHRTADLAIAFSPDTKIVVTAGDGVLKRWDVATGKLLGRIDDRRRFRVIYAPNGKWLTSGDDLVDATTGRVVRLLGKGGYAHAFSPDSKLLAAGTSDGALTLWNTATGEAVHKLQDKDKGASTAAFAADGQTVVTFGDGTARHWDLSKGTLLRSASVPVQGWRTLQLSPDGRTIAFVRKQEISLWDTTTGQLLGTLGPEAAKARYGIAYSPDARTLATDYHDDETGEARICIWEVANRKLLRQFSIPSHAGGFLHFAPDNRTLASSGHSEPRLRLWDTVTGKPLKQYAGHDESVGSLAFTPDGRTVLSSSNDGTVRVWNAADGRTIRALPERRGGLTALAVTPDGQAVLSGGYDATLLLQDWRNGQELRRLVLVPKESFCRTSDMDLIWPWRRMAGRRLALLGPARASLLSSFGTWPTAGRKSRASTNRLTFLLDFHRTRACWQVSSLCRVR